MARFSSLNIVVDDVVGLTKFLEALGVEVDPIDAEWEDWIPHHRSFAATPDVDADIDSSQFAHEWGGLGTEFRGVVVNLRIDDRDGVDRAYTIAIAQGAVSLKAPYDAFWGARFAAVESPFGIVFGLMSPSDPQFGGPPPFTP